MFSLVLLVVGNLEAQDVPVLPVKVTFRESLLVHGTFVAQFRNEGDKNLMLHVEMNRADGTARKTFDLLVTSNHFKEIGHSQGWIVKSTDEIMVRSEGYQDLQIHMP